MMPAGWLIFQCLGLGAVVAGVFLLFGLGVALLAGGVLLAGIAEVRS